MMNEMVNALKEYFKDYKGCKNCKFQPEPLQMCEYGKRRTVVELICSGWQKKEEKQMTNERRIE